MPRQKPVANSRRIALTASALALVLAGCGGGGGGTTTSAASPASLIQPVVPATTQFTAATAPTKLSAWNQMVSDGQTLSLRGGVMPYSLNTPLFSDYSHKFRTLSVPAGSQVTYTTQGPLQFPVGAVLGKTFFYPRATANAAGYTGARQTVQADGGETVDLGTNQLLETRLMVLEPSGKWGAVTYVWDADQRDATLLRTGKAINIELVSDQGVRTPFTYAVPNDGQCLTCHNTNVSTGRFEPIGPQANNLNRDYTFANGPMNQLDAMVAAQIMAPYTVPAPRMAVWNDGTVPLADRARAYLDVNCSACHNSAGRAGNTDLWLGLQETVASRLGVCKPPVGGQQNGRFTYDITPGNADASFLYFRINNYRLNSTPQAVAMPELGRHVFHTEGNALVRSWINSMTGCNG